MEECPINSFSVGKSTPAIAIRVPKVCRLCRARHKRQHADFLIMPTTRWKQQFGGARVVSGVGIIRSEVFQEGQQLVVRAVPCFFDAEGRSAREAFSFKRISAWRYICVVSTDSCPNQRAITERSTPCCRRSMAALCLRECGETFFPLSDGQVCLATLVYGAGDGAQLGYWKTKSVQFH